MTEFLKAIQGSELIYRLGWTLLHAVWLGAAVGAVFALSLLLLRRHSASARCLAGCVAMFLMVAGPVTTFFIIRAPARVSEAPARAIAVDVTVSAPRVEVDSAAYVSAKGLGDAPPTVAPPMTPISPQATNEVAPPVGRPWLARAAQVLEPALMWVVLAWTAGVMLLSVWQSAGWIAAYRLKRLATKPGDPALIEHAAQLAHTLRVSRPVRLLESMLVRVPTVLGWLRPVILLPVGLATGLSSQQVQAILAHELAHIRRYDYLVNLLQTLVETLLFYHPAMWFISRRVRVERENCCDDIALATGAERFSYAESLLHVVRQSAGGPRGLAALGATGLRGRGRATELRSRIGRLLGSGEEPGRRARSWPIAVIIIAALATSTLLINCGLQKPSATGIAAPPVTQPVVGAGGKHVDIDRWDVDEKGDWPPGKVVKGGGKPFGLEGDVYVFGPDEPKLSNTVKVARGYAGVAVTGLEFINQDGHPRVDIAFQFLQGKTTGGALFEIALLDDKSRELGSARVLELRNRDLPKELLGPHVVGGADPPNRSGKAELRFLQIDLSKAAISSYRLRVADAEKPLLTRLLADTDSYVRQCAARGLGQLGNEASDSLPAMKGLLLDQDEAVRTAAKEAVERVEKALAQPATQPAEDDAGALSDADIGRIVTVAVRDKSMGGGPLPPPGMVTTEGGRTLIRGPLQAVRPNEIVLKFPPPATHGLMVIPREKILSVQFAELATQPATQPATGLEFGPVREKTVRVPSAGRDNFLDLEAGKLLAYEDSNTPNEPTMSKELSQIYRRARWAKGSSADICLPPDGRFQKSVTGEAVTGLLGLDMRVVPTKEPFDRLTPEHVAEALADRYFYMINEMPCRVSDLPATFLVKTREGHLGVVQVAGVTDNPPGLKVRYRISSAPVDIGPEAPLWITLAPSEPTVKSLKELQVLAEVRSLNQEAGRSGEWEIRTADNVRRVARLPYPWGVSPDQLLPDGKRIIGGTDRMGRFGLDESQLRRVGAMEKGDYLLAWYVAGRRCSNVMPFRIDPAHDPGALPLLELAEVEMAPGQDLPVLVIRARRHAEQDPAPRTSDVAYPILNVDGQDRSVRGVTWTGPDGPLRVGGQYTYLLDLKWWTRDPQLKQAAPAIDPDKPHVIFAKVGRDKVQQTPPIRLSYARPLGVAWDLATSKLAPVTPLEAAVSLSGSVVDLQGKPGVNYEVSLSSEDGGTFRERADAAGKYRFLRIPPGTYKLGCNPPAMGQPELAISGVVIQAGRTTQQDISLAGKFILTGRVVDAGGNPVPKITVDLSCEDRQAGAEFMDTTQTDDQGRYKLGSPLGTVTYIGVHGKRINGNMPRLSAGENRVDFLADKGHFRAESATQPATQPAGGGENETVTRVYDVRDLFRPIRDMPAPAADALPPETTTKPNEVDEGALREKHMGAFIKTIVSTVDPKSWRPGGDVGFVKEVAGQLVITQTPRNHQDIIGLMKQLREARSLQVTIEARFITIPAKDEAELNQWAQKELKAALPAEAGAGILLSAQQQDLLLKRLPTFPGVRMLTAPRMTLFNGQRAYVTVGTLQGTLLPKAGSPNTKVVALLPEVTTLDVEATVSADRKSVTMTVLPDVTKILREGDQPEIAQAALATTKSIPEGQSLLLRMAFAAKKVVAAREPPPPASKTGDAAPSSKPTGESAPPKPPPRKPGEFETLVTEPSKNPAAAESCIYLLVTSKIIVTREEETQTIVTRRRGLVTIVTGEEETQTPATAPTSSGPSTQPVADAAEIDRLIKQLGSEKFAEREAAKQALAKIGAAARSALLRSVEDRDAERASRARELLKELHTISGTVMDDSGKALASVQIQLTSPQVLSAESTGSSRRIGDVMPGLAITDDEGKFQFGALLWGKTDIVVTKEGYRTRMFQNVPVGARDMKIRLALPYKYELSGRVLDAEGRPVGDAEVVLAERMHTIPGPDPSIWTVRSDAAGQFRFGRVWDPLTAETYRTRLLLVRKAGYAFWASQLDSTGGQSELTAQLSRPVKLTGQVQDRQGKGIPKARVWLRTFYGGDPQLADSGWGLDQLEQFAPRGQTDSDGKFLLEGLPPGGVAGLMVECPGYARKGVWGIGTSREAASLPNELRSMVTQGVDKPLAVRLEKAAVLRGTVIYEETGKPAGGVTVATQGSQTACDSNGRFELNDVVAAPSNLLVMVGHDRTKMPEWTAAAVVLEDLQAGQERNDLKLILTKGGIIRGKVTDASGHPLKGVNVAFYSAARPRPGGSCESIYTAEDGTWSYRFPPGEVYVYVEGRNPNLHGIWKNGTRTMEVEAGQTLDCDFELLEKLAADLAF